MALNIVANNSNSRKCFSRVPQRHPAIADEHDEHDELHPKMIGIRSFAPPLLNVNSSIKAKPEQEASEIDKSFQ